MSNRVYYNCHTHIFDVNVLPDEIMGPAFAKLIRALKFSKLPFWALKFLGFYGLFSDSSSVERLHMFFRAFSQGSQEEVFDYLVKEYLKFAPDRNFRYVVLSQDMDSNGVAKAHHDILRQVEDLSEIKNRILQKEKAKKLLPFLGINPHTHSSSEALLTFAKRYLNDRNFNGVKIYPSSGYFADDDKLMPLWEFCCKNEIPVMTHCTCGPIFYRGNVNERLGNKILYPELKANKVAQVNFTDMHYFRKVLNDIPKLKICFAHCGGMPEVKKHQKPDDKRVGEIQVEWYKQLKEMSLTYDNVYCDISFLNSDNERLVELKKDFESGRLNQDRLLYGTDFFVNMYKTSEHMAFNRSKDNFNFDRIASINPARYLSSCLYTADEFE